MAQIGAGHRLGQGTDWGKAQAGVRHRSRQGTDWGRAQIGARQMLGRWRLRILEVGSQIVGKGPQVGQGELQIIADQRRHNPP